MRNLTSGASASSLDLYSSAALTVVIGGWRLGCSCRISNSIYALSNMEEVTMTYTVSTPPCRIVGVTNFIISSCRRWTWKSAAGGSSKSSTPVEDILECQAQDGRLDPEYLQIKGLRSYRISRRLRWSSSDRLSLCDYPR